MRNEKIQIGVIYKFSDVYYQVAHIIISFGGCNNNYFSFLISYLKMLSFFARLTLRLAAGVEGLDAQERQRIASFFRSRQDSSGGFTGRQGGADIYYTSFAVRGLGLLGELDVPGLETYLVQKIEESRQASFSCTEMISLFFAAHLWEGYSGQTLLGDDIFSQLERFRRSDGGYASSEKAAFSSTYHTFLVFGLLEHLAPNFPLDEEDFLRFLQKRQRSDGGFVELEPLKHSGTNPTVAGLGLLACLRNRVVSLPIAPQREKALRYLKGCQTPDGGFQANKRIPSADLLSTFTALSMFYEEGCEDQIDLPSARNFVQSLKRETPGGLGYVGSPWDHEPDVEYTFYGLAAECLLSEPPS